MAIRILNIILAFTIFSSSAGFVVHQHFCRGTLQSVAVFFHAKGCEPENSNSNCSKEKERCFFSHHRMEHNCCDEESDYHKLDQDQRVEHWQHLAPEFPRSVSTAVLFPDTAFSETDVESLRHLRYRPPIVSCDIPVLFQVFLL